MGASNIAKRANAAQRRKQAIEMRLNGHQWQDIADRLNYSSRGAAHTDVKRALEQGVTELAVPREALRELELQRLDAELVRLSDLTSEVLPLLANPERKLLAVDRLLRIEEARRKNSERRSKLLGLDAPERVELTMEAIDAELDETNAEIAAELAAAEREEDEAAGTEGSES